jgi:hypothetical protein
MPSIFSELASSSFAERSILTPLPAETATPSGDKGYVSGQVDLGPTARLILEELVAQPHECPNPECSVRYWGLAETLAVLRRTRTMSTRTVRYHLGRLVEHGLFVERNGRVRLP